MHSSYKERESRVQRRILRKQLVEKIIAASATSKLNPRARPPRPRARSGAADAPNLRFMPDSGAGVHLAAIEV